MALPDTSMLVAGSAKTWDSSGTTGTITLTSLANGSGREGSKLSFAASSVSGVTDGALPEYIDVRFESSVASAATAGNLIELYFGESDSGTAGTANPGNLTGADAALSNPDELKLQCSMVGGLVLSNARGTNVQKQRFRFYPALAYLVPLVVNKSGQSLSGTAADHKVVATPYYRTTVD